VGDELAYSVKIGMAGYLARFVELVIERSKGRLSYWARGT
jgi:hypothetical protein